MGHTEEAHQQLRGQAAGVYCWNTVPGSDEVVYQTANNGYPVILCNVGNFYMDMAYKKAKSKEEQKHLKETRVYLL